MQGKMRHQQTSPLLSRPLFRRLNYFEEFSRVLASLRKYFTLIRKENVSRAWTSCQKFKGHQEPSRAAQVYIFWLDFTMTQIYFFFFSLFTILDFELAFYFSHEIISDAYQLKPKLKLQVIRRQKAPRSQLSIISRSFTICFVDMLNIPKFFLSLLPWIKSKSTMLALL